MLSPSRHGAGLFNGLCRRVDAFPLPVYFSS